MKAKQITFYLIAVSFMIFTSCNNGTEMYRGNYSFKTSGSVELALVDTIEHEPIVSDFTTEFGQMDIITTDKKNGQMIVTMNIFNGEIITVPATEHDGILFLDTINRNVSLKIDNIKQDNIRLRMSGKGSNFENTVIFNLEMSGSFSILRTEYRIISSDIRCVASEN